MSTSKYLYLRAHNTIVDVAKLSLISFGKSPTSTCFVGLYEHFSHQDVALDTEIILPEKNASDILGYLSHRFTHFLTARFATTFDVEKVLYHYMAKYVKG